MKNLLKNKVVLITGGTGFLGKALVREISKYSPYRIRVFSRDEVKHHKLQEEFKHLSNLRNFVGDIRDYERLKKAMQKCDIVIHAAALKRVDMIEYNVDESIKTNILGTLNVVRAALENNVDKVIFVSTDKACSPINTYGSCKFVGERIFLESNYSAGYARTKFICVRYGNVINSTGSAIPFFIQKAKNKQEIPVTDERMTRFLITSKQAVELIFDAIKYGNGGEIFVPNLPSFKIVDLAEYLKNKYESNEKIKIIGIRPGEKLHELLINECETPRTYEFGRNFIIFPQIEKYLDKKHYSYFLKNKKVNFKEFSSKDKLLEGEKLQSYLDKINFEEE